MPFWRRKKKEAKEDEPKEEPAQAQESLSERICKKYGRPDLHEPLSYTRYLEPRGRDVESLLAEESPLNYSIVANVKMYEGKPESAKKYFEDAVELGISRKEHYLALIDSIEIATKISMELWEAEGKYKELKTKEE